MKLRWLSLFAAFFLLSSMDCYESIVLVVLSRTAASAGAVGQSWSLSCPPPRFELALAERVDDMCGTFTGDASHTGCVEITAPKLLVYRCISERIRLRLQGISL